MFKDSLFEILDGSKDMEAIKSNLSYDDLCTYLAENEGKLFRKYVRIKILNYWWDADKFLKQEVN